MSFAYFPCRVEVVAHNLGWGEGPTYLTSATGYVFSDIAADTMYLFDSGGVRVFRSPSNRANGNTTDLMGRLVTCEHATRRVTRTELDGSITVLADMYEGRPLNSPNDVVVAGDDAIWFTDPPYGILRGECGPGAMAEQPSGVYRLDPISGILKRVLASLDKPNGLVFSGDENRLYVSDTGSSHHPGGNHHIFRYDVVDADLFNMVVFAAIAPGVSDGIRIDELGNLWTSSGNGVQCFSGEGLLLGMIDLGEMSTNLCFLNRMDGLGLFVTTPTRAIVCAFSPSDFQQGFARDSRVSRSSVAKVR